MKVLITGVGGQLGSELKDLSVQYPSYSFKFVDRLELPFDQVNNIKDYLNENNPHIIINCAAYTAVDKAETEQELASLINFKAVKVISDWVKENDRKLIHISTDYVFQGDEREPIKESESTNPINFYGFSKEKGEQAIIESNSNSIIIRTSWVYSTYGHNFVKTMIRLMSERDSISVINDQIGSPTYAKDLAIAIMKIIKGDTFSKGIYHYSNEGEISWYEFAKAIQEISGLECEINPIPTQYYPTPAKRPKYSLLDKSKIKATYDVEVPEWKNSLKSMMDKLNVK
ncbi:dTDP-4-dehydrorhamnose reductase [Sphingobacterium mizutaii]|uniref:dTDP-4-dehydrorhamnose reductase n=1 Tax=Sphingobacterium mizutaii TaxID=1010 RepID=UPI0028ABD716|nr:dTDP-4-dehydrorhamnose reductase [Sphingobacterium mizutaii]